MQGTVANFVETEQILELKPHNSSKAPVVCSFVQIRGSIPLLWSQIPNVKYKPPTKVSPAADTQPAFDAHISDLLQTYKVRLEFLVSRAYEVPVQERLVMQGHSCSAVGPRACVQRIAAIRTGILTLQALYWSSQSLWGFGWLAS